METTILIERALSVWPADNFKEIVKQEIEQLNPELIPLQQGLSQGSYVADEPFKVVIIGVTEANDSILVKAGIFYKSIIAGCSCADDPTPIDTIQEYCVFQFDIDQSSGETSIELIIE